LTFETVIAAMEWSGLRLVGRLACFASSPEERAMNKAELVEAVAEDAGLSKVDAGRAIDSLLLTVQRTLKKGDEVAITGFGKFSVAHRGARTGRNPQTGAALKIKASKTPKFSAGAALKQAVSGRSRT